MYKGCVPLFKSKAPVPETFKVAGRETNYTLTIGDFKGTNNDTFGVE